MDVSAVFKACVKTVSLRNKDLGITVNSSKNVLRKSRSKSAFYIKTQGVVTQVTKLRDFLLENRKAYLNFSQYLSSAPHITDLDRDEIDTGAQQIMSTCYQLIKELKREVAELETSLQNIEHREIMLLLIEEYLKNVCKIYSEQKAIRVKRTVELRKISKLEVDKPITIRSKNESVQSGEPLLEKYNSNKPTESNSYKVQEINGDINMLSYEEELSPEDVQLFESENEHLYNELNILSEEVRQIETKVVHIAELQELFTEKVLDQDRDVDRIITTVVGSTENVKEANEQIRQAIQRNAGLRVWILFFLLVMSFSLLFLDWYNP